MTHICVSKVGQRHGALMFSLICLFLYSRPSTVSWWYPRICKHNDNHHNSDVIMGAIGSQITSHTIVYSTIYSSADQRKHRSFASLSFVRGIHRWPVNSPHKWPVTRKIFPSMTSSWCTGLWDEKRTSSGVTVSRYFHTELAIERLIVYDYIPCEVIGKSMSNQGNQHWPHARNGNHSLVPWRWNYLKASSVFLAFSVENLNKWWISYTFYV